MKRIILIMTLICITISCSAFMVKRKKDPGYLYARKYGAKANIELHVIDDDGKPVPDANVEVFMGMNLRNKGRWITGTTNTNGVFLVKGKTTGNEIEYYIKKDGYYKTVKLFTFAEMGKEHNVVDGKWQPYGERETIVLREIKNPKIPSCGGKYVFTKEKYSWIGFDLLKGDFVKPHGNGEHSDFEVYIEWDGKTGQEFTKVAIKFRFVEKYSGYYITEKKLLSDFKGPYIAKPSKIDLNTVEYSISRRKDGERIYNIFDSSQSLVIRSRCVINTKGELLSSNFSIIEDIRFYIQRDGKVKLGLSGYFNPTPNDTNLEPEKVPTHSF